MLEAAYFMISFDVFLLIIFATFPVWSLNFGANVRDEIADERLLYASTVVYIVT